MLGAFLDAGLPLADLRQALGSLALTECEVAANKVLRAGVSATHFVVREGATPPAGQVPSDSAVGNGQQQSEHVHGLTHDHSHGAEGSRVHVHGQEDADHGHHHEPAHTHGHEHTHGHTHDHGHDHDARHSHEHRSLPEIERLIDRSALSSAGRERAKAMFHRLAEAEARIHQMPVERVHLHEVGALDSIVDIVGAVFAMEWAGVDEVICSPLNVGSGMVKSAHGLFPVPAPATLALLGDAPVYSGAVRHELVTPTGALIATTYAGRFATIPSMSIERIGYGAGSRDHRDTPNVLRILIGRRTNGHDEASARPAMELEAGPRRNERVSVIECEIDDMNPQLFGVAMDRLLAAGALDVFFVPAQMKKNRPGTLMTIIAPPDRRVALSTIVFEETTTIGVRYHDMERETLQREVIGVETAAGRIRVKVARRDGRIINVVPEFDDCAAVAREKGWSVKAVQALALQAFGPLPAPTSNG